MDKNYGKIRHNFFNEFIKNKCGLEREEVHTGPGFGVDVSVVNLIDNQALILASDPVSLIPQLGLEESAWLSVHITANDIATTGYSPLFGQFVLNLPSNFSQKDFQIYWDYIHQFCVEIGLSITGGHTGFVEGQNSTVVGGATFGTIAPQNEILTSKMANPGDRILVTKSCGISASAILALTFPETVKNKAGIENYQNACNSFYDSSILKEALGAVSLDNKKYITAMHDVTEGGVLGAIFEMATASENGALVHDDQLPIHETQSEVLKAFSLDPRYTLGSGALIITCKEEGVESTIHQLKKLGISCTEVGSITKKDEGIKLMKNGKRTDILYLENDPYWTAFSKAIKSEWK